MAECSPWSILQYFRPSLSYYLSLRFLFCLFLSGQFTQVLLYIYIYASSVKSHASFALALDYARTVSKITIVPDKTFLTSTVADPNFIWPFVDWKPINWYFKICKWWIVLFGHWRIQRGGGGGGGRFPEKSQSYQARIQCWAIIGTPAKCNLTDVSLASWWWPTDSGLWILSSPSTKKNVVKIWPPLTKTFWIRACCYDITLVWKGLTCGWVQAQGWAVETSPGFNQRF